MSFQEKMLKVEPTNLLEYKEEIPELQLLEKCEQSPTWHKEGNVLNHTNMVLEKAHELCQSIPNHNDRVSIYLGALLHDFGKPKTTFQKEGRIVAYNHEQVGVTKAREFLRKYFPQFGFARREWILSLVEYHGHPKKMMNEEWDDVRLKRFSLEVNTEQVYNVEVADFLGRIGESVHKSTGFLDIFKQKCKELDIWDKYYEIPNVKHLSQFAYNLARWEVLFHFESDTDELFLQKMETLSKKEPACELMITVGAPGSGKTSHIQKLYPHVKVISPDVERQRWLHNVNDQSKNDFIFNYCYRELSKTLKQRTNVIWDATNCTRKRRKQLIDTARRNGVMVSFLYFDLPLPILLERNEHREKKVPTDIVELFYNTLQSPKPYEYDCLLVVNEDKRFNL